MAKISRTLLKLLVATSLCVGLTAQAALIYDNSSNDLNHRFNPGLLEVGDEINLAGTERWLTSFDFEYYGLASGAAFAGVVEARVRIYLNDGDLYSGYPTPSTSLFDSGWVGGFTPTDRNAWQLNAGAELPATGLFIPANTLTWSVQFRGLGTGDELGLDVYDPPTVGTSFLDYWQNNSGSWALRTNGVPINFAARLNAEVSPVPEPGTTALLVLGGLSLVALIRRRG